MVKTFIRHNKFNMRK